MGVRPIENARLKSSASRSGRRRLHRRRNEYRNWGFRTTSLAIHIGVKISSLPPMTRQGWKSPRVYRLRHVYASMLPSRPWSGWNGAVSKPMPNSANLCASSLSQNGGENQELYPLHELGRNGWAKRAFNAQRWRRVAIATGTHKYSALNFTWVTQAQLLGDDRPHRN